MGGYFLLQGIFFDSGIKSLSLVSPALAGGFFTTATPGKPHFQSWKVSNIADVWCLWCMRHDSKWELARHNVQEMLDCVSYNQVIFPFSIPLGGNLFSGEIESKHLRIQDQWSTVKVQMQCHTRNRKIQLKVLYPVPFPHPNSDIFTGLWRVHLWRKGWWDYKMTQTLCEIVW